jgi:hypothetical protein
MNQVTSRDNGRAVYSMHRSGSLRGEKYKGKLQKHKLVYFLIENAQIWYTQFLLCFQHPAMSHDKKYVIG